MPYQPILPTWGALNGGTFTSPSGITDSRTGLPVMAGGLNIGDYFDLTAQEALSLSKTSVGTLLPGRYRFVQIDSGATAANVVTGGIGLLKNLTNQNYAGPINYVTTYDRAPSLNTPRKVVFLCPITAGQSLTSGVFAFVQELGLANVLLKSGLGNGSPAVGDNINITSTGADDPSSQTITQARVGVAQSLPATAALCTVLLTAPDVQE